MDDMILYDDIKGMLDSPPTLAPRPNFFRLRAFRRYIVDVMKQIPHPMYPQHGWAGMVLQPAIFALINATPFAVPPNPGLYAVYHQFATPSAMKMIDSQHKIDKNLYKTYTNIHRAVYKVLQASVLPQYQASATPGLTGWDASMSIIDIFAQLDATFGKPDAQAQLANDSNFRAPLPPTETPETLFRRLEECQEIQVLANNPYTETQLITNAVLVLRQANIFPVKDFDDWEMVQPKSWAIMKTYFHGAFTRRLNAISMNPTSGQHGYANPNPYAIFNTTHDEDDSTTSTQHTLATTTVPPVGSTIGGSTMSPEVAAALTQLSNNQNALMTQMAALSVRPPQQITIPTGQQFTQGSGYRGQGGGRGGRDGGRGRGGRRGRGRGSFAQATQNSNIPQVGGQVTPQFGGGAAPMYAPNPIKRFNNWNYCFSCGFDVEDGHTSATCPRDWRKTGHQEGCTRQNVQQYIAAGHAASIKGQHKNQLPAGF